MKKLLLVGLTAVLLSGCNNNTGDEINGELVDIGNLGKGYDLVRDKNTGCVYMRQVMGQAHPLTAYYDEDGKVVGCGEKELDKTKYE